MSIVSKNSNGGQGSSQQGHSIYREVSRSSIAKDEPLPKKNLRSGAPPVFRVTDEEKESILQAIKAEKEKLG